jgi:hypothetical protein
MFLGGDFSIVSIGKRPESSWLQKQMKRFIFFSDNFLIIVQKKHILRLSQGVQKKKKGSSTHPLVAVA